ncbi:MAG: CHAT domain-containing tetratricopeptide repeat protein, partial [Myxococcales bacterium]
KGDYGRAGDCLFRALAIREAKQGLEHPDLANTVHLVGDYYLFKGDYAGAEMYYRRVLAIYVNAYGPSHPDVASALQSLAYLFIAKRDYFTAEPILLEARRILETAWGVGSEQTLNVISDLGYFYEIKGDYDRALPLNQQALAMVEKMYGANDWAVAPYVLQLGRVYMLKGDYQNAEPALRRALSIKEEAYGPDSAWLSGELVNLAVIYRSKGEYVLAEGYLLRALANRVTVQGRDNPVVADIYKQLAWLYQAKGEHVKAVQSMAACNDIRETTLGRILSVGTEYQKLGYAASLGPETDTSIALHLTVAPDDIEAAKLAMLTVLRRKGRVLDLMAADKETLRAHLTPDVQVLLDRLSAARTELSVAVLPGLGNQKPEIYAARVRALEDQVQSLETSLSVQSSFYRSQQTPVTLQAVQEALPPNSALVEYMIYRPVNFKAYNASATWGAPRYAVYVLQPSGVLRWADLGDALEIDALVQQARSAMADLKADAKTPARLLDEKVLRPVRSLVPVNAAGGRVVFLSPDGALNLIPFGALVDEEGVFAIERMAITYLSSGRDLLRFSVQSPSDGSPVVFANPDFGPPAGRVRVGNRSAQPFPQLSGTGEEASAIVALLSSPQVVTGKNASKQALTGVKRVPILHIATTGISSTRSSFPGEEDSNWIRGRPLVPAAR